MMLQINKYMLNQLIRFLSFYCLTLVTVDARSDDLCKNELLNAYINHRSALLSINLSTDDVRATLQPNLTNQIVGNFDEYIFSLRVREARIINLIEYSATCDINEGTLRMKIVYEKNKFDRLYVTLKKYGGKYLVYSSSATNASVEFDSAGAYQKISTSNLSNKSIAH